MRLILLGLPGSGKGTQAKLLCAHLDMAHISTGDILREAVRAGTPLGRQAKPYMEQGKYVPDTLVNDMVAERFLRDDRPERFLMDGYPRTLAQAASFDQALRQAYLGLDAVVLLEVPDEEIVRRASGRRVCPKDGAVYHLLYQPPKAPGLCDRCGTALEQRADDREDTVRERLRVFHETMPAVIDFYRQQGLVKTVSGEGSVQDIFAAILRSLGMESRSC